MLSRYVQIINLPSFFVVSMMTDESLSSMMTCQQLDSKHFLHVKEKKMQISYMRVPYLSPAAVFQSQVSSFFQRCTWVWWDLKVNYCQIISFLFVLKHQPLATLTWPLPITKFLWGGFASLFTWIFSKKIMGYSAHPG